MSLVPQRAGEVQGPGVVRTLDTGELVRCYLRAKRKVIEAGYWTEIHWQDELDLSRVTRQLFMREATWVILAAGLSDLTVRRLFPRIAALLHGFHPDSISQDRRVAEDIISVFKHRGKTAAIVEIATRLARLDDYGLRALLREDATGFIQTLPYMGPATSRHLAKNIGCQVAKPDRHLVRLARSARRRDPDALCGEISQWLGEPVAVVDLVLWRWATLHARECVELECDGIPHL